MRLAAFRNACAAQVAKAIESGFSGEDGQQKLDTSLLKAIRFISIKGYSQEDVSRLAGGASMTWLLPPTSVTLPIVGTPIDVNWANLMASLGFSILFVWLLLCLRREIQNIRLLLYEKTGPLAINQELAKLRDNGQLLGVIQMGMVFTTPSDGGGGGGQRSQHIYRAVPVVALLVPIGLLACFLGVDGATFHVGALYSRELSMIALILDAVFFAFNFVLACWCIRHQVQLVDICSGIDQPSRPLHESFFAWLQGLRGGKVRSQLEITEDALKRAILAHATAHQRMAGTAKTLTPQETEQMLGAIATTLVKTTKIATKALLQHQPTDELRHLSIVDLFRRSIINSPAAQTIPVSVLDILSEAENLKRAVSLARNVLPQLVQDGIAEELARDHNHALAKYETLMTPTHPTLSMVRELNLETDRERHSERSRRNEALVPSED
jgi:hypothetical protein